MAPTSDDAFVSRRKMGSSGPIDLETEQFYFKSISKDIDQKNSIIHNIKGMLKIYYNRKVRFYIYLSNI